MTRSTDMEQEFREFVAARSGALLRTAYLLAGDWATAEDLLQTTLTKTYLAWKRLGQIEAVEPYTRRVLVNTATSWWRRRWHGEKPTEVLPELPGPDRHEEAVERDALWQLVRALPTRQRAVLVLRFYEDLSEAQTAELLDISIGTVKSQTARALATLRKRLGSNEMPLVPGQAAIAGSAPGDRTEDDASTRTSAAESAPVVSAPAGASPAGVGSAETGSQLPAASRPDQPQAVPVPAARAVPSARRQPARAHPAARGDRG